jgi:hypothetical protein
MTLELSDKFKDELKKGENKPAVLVYLGESDLENEQSTQSDWAANTSETQVDYNSEPGFVRLGPATAPNETQTTTDAQATIITAAGAGYTAENTLHQSFQQTTGGSRQINSVIFRFNNTFPPVTVSVTCSIYSGYPFTGFLGQQTQTYVVDGTFGLAFLFYDNNIFLEDSTEYWFVISANGGQSDTGTLELDYNTAGGYANGQLNSRTSLGVDSLNIGDADFTMIQQSTNYYQTSGSITTQVMNLGETPTVDGEWILKDSNTSNTTLTYNGWGSTDNFSASNVDLGAIVDGDAITGTKYQYYKVVATFGTTNQSETPLLNSVAVNFTTYLKFSDRLSLGYEPSVKTIGSLTTKIDDFEESSVGQMSITMGLTEIVSNYLYSAYPKNRPVKIKIGFDESDWTEDDFINFYWGAIQDYKINSNNDILITVRDNTNDFSVTVPREEHTVGGPYAAPTYTSITAAAEHPADIALEIIQTHLDVRDSKIDTESFSALATALSGWAVTRTITGDGAISANTLLNELRILMTSYLIPLPTGKVKIAQYNKMSNTGELVQQQFTSVIEDVRRLWSDGTYLYSVNGDEGIASFLINTDGTLTFVDSDDQGGSYVDIFGNDDFIFCACGLSGIRSYTASNGILTYKNVDLQGGAAQYKAVWADENFVYATDQVHGFMSYTVDANGAFTFIDNDIQAITNDKIWGDGSFIYIASGGTGVMSYSVDAGGNLTHIATNDQGDIYQDVYGDGTFLYCANDTGGMLSYSVSSAGAFTFIDRSDPGGTMEAVFCKNGVIYGSVGDSIGSTVNGLSTFTVDYSGNLYNVDYQILDDQTGISSGLWVDDNYAYMASILSGIYTYTIIEPDHLTDNDFIDTLSYDGNADSLINKVFTETDYNTGTEAYDHIYITYNSTSVSNYNQTAEKKISDQWTLDAQAAQIGTMGTNIVGRYANPKAILSGTMDANNIKYEVNDHVFITTTQWPSSDFAGCVKKRFQIINKNVNWQKGTIKFKFLEV